METLFDKGMAEPEQPERESVAQRPPMTADDVRQMMVDIIGALSGDDDIPYQPEQLTKHKAMFPIMAQWLPQAEGDALVEQFEAAWRHRGFATV